MCNLKKKAQPDLDLQKRSSKEFPVFLKLLKKKNYIKNIIEQSPETNLSYLKFFLIYEKNINYHYYKFIYKALKKSATYNLLHTMSLSCNMLQMTYLNNSKHTIQKVVQEK